MHAALYQLGIAELLFKSCSSFRLFLSFFVCPRIPLKSSWVRVTNSLISFKSSSHLTKWFSTAFRSSSTVFKSFSGSFPPSNFLTASINSRDLLLSNGAGLDPEFFRTGIWEAFLLFVLGLLIGLPLRSVFWAVADEGSFRDWEKKLMTLGTAGSRSVYI